jgi:hypothetical protein
LLSVTITIAITITVVTHLLGVNESFSYNSRTFRDHVIANHFSDLRDENKRLLAERENLRRALTDREEDVRLLRAQLQKEKQFKISEDVRHSLADFGVEEKISENLVKQIEKLQIKCASLKQDLQVQNT